MLNLTISQKLKESFKMTLKPVLLKFLECQEVNKDSLRIVKVGKDHFRGRLIGFVGHRPPSHLLHRPQRLNLAFRGQYLKDEILIPLISLSFSRLCNYVLNH